MFRQGSQLLPSALRATFCQAAGAEGPTSLATRLLFGSPSSTLSRTGVQSRTYRSSAPSLESPSSGEESISVTFIDKDDKEHTVQAPIGKNFLEVAHDNEIDLEGACEASLACSTCHLIIENEEYYKRIPEAIEDELDMLDLAFGLTDTSRLGCQIIATKDIDGIRVRIPSLSRNLYVKADAEKAAKK